MTNTLYEALFAPHATNHSTFLKCDDGVELSYADFLKRAAQMAKAIVVAGLTPGDRIVVQTPKTRETLALYAAAIQAGGVYLPLNNAYTFDELSYSVHDSKPAVIVCDPKNEAEVSVLANHIGAALLTLGLSGGSLSEAADQQDTASKVSPHARAIEGLCSDHGQHRHEAWHRSAKSQMAAHHSV